MKKAGKENSATHPCPCGGGAYADCCGRFVGQGSATRTPQTALELMRSRYTAYTLLNEDYVQASWHASTRPARVDLSQDASKWLGLEILRHVVDGDSAVVEFVARCKIGGRAQRLHETSRFVRENGQWFYVDGIFPGG